LTPEVCSFDLRGALHPPTTTEPSFSTKIEISVFSIGNVFLTLRTDKQTIFFSKTLLYEKENKMHIIKHVYQWHLLKKSIRHGDISNNVRFFLCSQSCSCMFQYHIYFNWLYLNTWIRIEFFVDSIFSISLI
jgi:hypothetical protein